MLFRHRFLMLRIGLMFAVVLSGCADNSLSPEARFNADPASKNESDGLVLIGLRVTREPTRRNWLLGDLGHYKPTYRVTLNQITEDGKLATVARTVNICEPGRDMLYGALSACSPGTTQHKLISVPAGRYSLGTISYLAARTRVVTTALNRPGTPLRVGDLVLNPARSFLVQEGEIAYVGNLSFDFSPYVNASGARLTLDRDDGGAKAALQSYPNIKGDPVFKSILGAAGQQLQM